MHLLTNPLVKWRGKMIDRIPTDEDENVEKAAKQRREWMGRRLSRTWFSRYAHRLVLTPNTKEMDGFTTMRSEIEIRDWRWMLTFRFFPPEHYQRPSSVVDKAPWRTLMRCLLVDLLSQVKDGAEPLPWKRHPVEPLMPVSWVTFDKSDPYMAKEASWGYRAVFSQQLSDKPRSLTGAWLVIVYTAAEDRKWLAQVDERTLITKENLWRMRAWKMHKNNKTISWHKFWCSASGDRSEGLACFPLVERKGAKLLSATLERDAERLFLDDFSSQWLRIEEPGHTK